MILENNTIPWTFLVVALSYLIAKYIIYPGVISPISRIPCAHWSARYSSAWILWKRYSAQEIRSIHNAHEKLGPVIRLAPLEVSVNCIEGGIKTIYMGGFEKHEWYSNMFDNYGVPNMFSTSHSKPHSVRKRMLSNVYSKSVLLNSESMRLITEELIFERLLPILEDLAQKASSFDIFPILSAGTMDFVTSYLFGLSGSSDWLRNTTDRDTFLQNYDGRQQYNFWPQELPKLTRWLRRLQIRAVPSWVDAANKSIENWTLMKCDKSNSFSINSDEQYERRDVPTVYLQLKSALMKADRKLVIDENNKHEQLDRLNIASEMMDHLAAGFDTSGIILYYFIHEISRNPEWQRRLRNELFEKTSALSYAGAHETKELPSVRVIDSLEVLQATLQETLRLRSAIPGPQPRITPDNGCRLGPSGEYKIPGGVRVSAQAHSLHRNEEVFPDANKWLPERWLIDAESAKFKEMNRWFWAFGSGGRMCVGSNLAIYQMKYIIAAIYSNWETVIVDDSGSEQKDMYTAPPESGKLVIKLVTPHKM